MKKMVIMLIAGLALCGAAYNAVAVTPDSLVVVRPQATYAEWYGSHTQPSPVYLNGATTTQIGFGLGKSDLYEKYLLGNVHSTDANVVDIVCLQNSAGGYRWVAGHSTVSGGVGSFSSNATSTINSIHLYGTNYPNFGSLGTTCFLADINGDGYKDAINCGNTYVWYAIPSSSTGLTNDANNLAVPATMQGPATIYIAPEQTWVAPLTSQGGVQVGDFDGNGKADICFVTNWDTAHNARWKVKKTSTSIGDGDQVEGFFGLDTDTFLVGDINGDKRDDAIFVRNWDGTNLRWEVKYAASDGKIDGVADSNALFGWVGDTPFVADIDGDGRKDIGVTRNSNISGGKYWYVSFTNSDGKFNVPSGSVFADVNDVGSLGVTGDIPLVGKLGTAPAVSGTNCVYTLFGDFNGDCVVGLADLKMLAANWLTDCINANPNPGGLPCEVPTY
jgi:hypothetical protein